MSETKQINPACDRALQQMDSHISDGADGSLLEHCEQCPACASEFSRREHLRSRLKTAVQGIAAPPFLEARIRNNIRSAQSPRWGLRLAPAAAAVIVCVAGLIAYQLGHLRMTTRSQESYIASASNHLPTIMRVGFGDHAHCAVFRKYPKNPPSVEHLAGDLGPQFSGLIPIVREHVPADYTLMMGHQCSYHKRKFVHFALTRDSKILSLVIAKKDDGESFQTEDLLPALSNSGIPFYRNGVHRFQIAAFETRDRLVYVISELPPQENMDLMIALAPELSKYLKSLES